MVDSNLLRRDMATPVDDESTLLRAVVLDKSHIERDNNTNSWIPTKTAITFEHGEESVYCDELLRIGHTYRDVALHGGQRAEQRVTFQFNAGASAAIKFPSYQTPNEDTPIGYAHCDVLVDSDLSKGELRNRRARFLALLSPIDPSEIRF